MKTLTAILIFFALCSTSYSCYDRGTDPSPTFEGITETDEQGPTPIGKVDADDWKLLENCPGDKPPVDTTKPVVVAPTCTILRPAYPNPTTKQFILSFSMATTDSVVIILNSTIATVKDILRKKLPIGSHTISVEVSDLKAGIYRVYFSVHKSDVTLSTYGDVQIE
jgi:hypothetical protein